MFPPETLILIVDDMAPMRRLVKGQVRNLGYRNLIEADNGKKAFQMLQEAHASGKPVGIILSDWNMPVMTGIDFLKKVRSTPEFKDLPFIMITAESDRAQILEAVKSGVSNYVMKPFTPQMFQQKFKGVWEKMAAGGGVQAQAGAPAKPATAAATAKPAAPGAASIGAPRPAAAPTAAPRTAAPAATQRPAAPSATPAPKPATPIKKP